MLCEACAALLDTAVSCLVGQWWLLILAILSMLLKTAVAGSTITESMRLYNVSFKLHTCGVSFCSFLSCAYKDGSIESILSEQQRHAHKAHTAQWQQSTPANGHYLNTVTLGKNFVTPDYMLHPFTTSY